MNFLFEIKLTSNNEISTNYANIYSYFLFPVTLAWKGNPLGVVKKKKYNFKIKSVMGKWSIKIISGFDIL